ncbi:MAG: CRISPR-associated protein Cas4 [Candidatus Omnitrophica bacterium]|nr:CRISPR-associated protein Cas4 [Candidatus Omnitrophota bacterium]
MSDEDNLIPVSAIAHMAFCPRRVALIYIEHVWEENIATLEGAHLHERVDREGRVESRGDVRLVRGLRLRSMRLGLTGKADMIEFHRLAHHDDPQTGVELPHISGRWRPFPVEYKRGKLRNEEGYIAQLCAQALCLEEMLGVPVPNGAIFFGKTRRRLDVKFDDALRQKTDRLTTQLHQLFRSSQTPQAHFQKKCNFCSLKNLCLPKAMKSRHNAHWYISTIFEHPTEEDSLS